MHHTTNRLKLVFACLMGSTAFSTSAQSFSWIENGTNNTAQTSYTVNIDAGLGGEIKFDLKNNASSAKSFKVKQTVISLPSGCTPNNVTYCTPASCYMPALTLGSSYTGVHIVNINAGQIIGASAFALKTDISTGDCCGIYTLEYTAFDANNPTDKTTVTVVYNVTNCSNGIKEKGSEAYVLSQFIPNPATSTTKINYTFSAQTDKAVLRIMNTFGSLVKEIKLKEDEGYAEIETGELASGLYFCSLVINGKNVETKKLMVNH